MKKYLLLIVFVICCNQAMAQQDKVVIQFVDAIKEVRLRNVTIMNKSGAQVSRTDTAGYAIVPLSFLSSNGYLIALCPGYQLDTIRTAAATVYMYPLSSSLEEAVVRSNPVKKLLQAPNEFVVDYDFDGDNIIIATYSGNSGGNAKLFLMNSRSDVVTTTKVPSEPLSLYTSCVGRHYCVCTNKLYPLNVADSILSLAKPYNSNIVQGLQQCQCTINGNQYHKLADRQNFIVEYGLYQKTDSSYKSIIRFEEKDVAMASFQEWMEILSLLEQLEQKAMLEAARRQFMRLKWDKGSFAHINMPLYTKNDTLIIFDFFKKKILLYNADGNPIGNTPIRFVWKQSQQFRILKDEATGRFYIHRYDKQDIQTIEELDINNGTTSVKMPVGKPFAEDVKIHNNKLYFLWQDGRNGATRQLFGQGL